MVSGSAKIHVFIHPGRLRLLVPAFNPLTFKVIINLYYSITVFLTVWGLFSMGLFLALCFLPKELPLTSIIKLVSLNFCLSSKVLIQSPMGSLLLSSGSWCMKILFVPSKT